VKQEAELIELVVGKAPKPTHVDRAVASICSTLMQCLPNSKDERIDQIPKMLEVLSHNKQRLIAFAKESASFKSMEQLINHLELALEQIENPSLAWEQVSTVEEALIDYKDILIDVTVREPFERAMHGLTPIMQTLVIDTLRVPNLLSVEERIQAMVPVLFYIGRFSRSQQTLWGAEYIGELDTLLNENPKHVLITSLEISSPMSFGHFNGLMHLAEHYSTDEASLKETFKFLGNAIKDSPEQRVRMLTKWSSWVGDMKQEESHHFLNLFCNSMEPFVEGRDWDTFTNLVRKTEAWWNKADGEHQPQILKLWGQLAAHKENLPHLNNFLKWGVSLPGKAWFQVLTIVLSLDAKELLKHEEKIQAVWTITDSKKITKREKFDYFSKYILFLLELHEIFPTEEANNWMDTITSYSADRRTRIFDEMQKHKALFTEHPNICKWMLNQLSNPSLTQIDLRLNSLGLVASYNKEHPEVSMDYLFSGLERFNEQGTTVWTQVHRFLQKKPEHTTKILFDHAMESFQDVPLSTAPLVESVITTFYKAVSEHKKPKKILDSDNINKWFGFNAPEEGIRKQRLVFMQLLFSKALVTEESEATSKPKEVYQWSVEHNDHLFELGLNRYLEHTSAILGVQEPQFNLHKGNDLSVSQQVSLLKVATEMKQIGALQLFSIKSWDTDNNVNALDDELHSLLNAYKASRFKAQSRQEQVNEFEAEVRKAFTSSKRESRYEMILHALHNAKMTAITSDIQEDRTRWFKMNRGGESRYYNVLNQMQDLVLRHWVKDKQSIQRIQTIEQFKQNEFNSLVGLFNQRMLEEYPREWEPKSKEFGMRLSRFFTSTSKQKKINVVIETLNSFINSTKEVDNVEQLDLLMSALQKNASILPGHLQTLCKELLTRGAALNEFYQQKGKNKGLEAGLGL
jgi:hypothetical protein